MGRGRPERRATSRLGQDGWEIGVAGYPKGALRRLQLIELELLVEIRRVCGELGLTWFVDSGTCLGAVRHGGFIPWDDDIDVALPLGDYRTFCERAPALLSREYGLYTHENTPNYPPLWAKVYRKGTRFMSEQMLESGFEQGIFVDVFAYCRLDSAPRIAARQVRGFNFWQRASYLYCTSKVKIPANAPCKPLLCAGCAAAHGLARAFLSPRFIGKRARRCIERGNGQGDWSDISYAYFGTFKNETLFPVKPLLFEGEKFPAPHDTDTYLRTFYGDYLQLPPESERGAHPPRILDFGNGENVMEEGSQGSR